MLDLIANLGDDCVKHLDPRSIYLEDGGKAKVLCGDTNVFDPPLVNFGTQKYGQLHLEKEYARFLTPLRASLVLKNGSKEQTLQKPEDNDSRGQLLWDLGIILYELASGNMHPFANQNTLVSARLIKYYHVAFPVNMENEVSGHLKDLIFQLLMKNVSERIGFVDSVAKAEEADSKIVQSVQDVKNHLFFK